VWSTTIKAVAPQVGNPEWADACVCWLHAGRLAGILVVFKFKGTVMPGHTPAGECRHYPGYCWPQYHRRCGQASSSQGKTKGNKLPMRSQLLTHILAARHLLPSTGISMYNFAFLGLTW
jgi:hypothetical protein